MNINLKNFKHLLNFLDQIVYFLVNSNDFSGYSFLILIFMKCEKLYGNFIMDCMRILIKNELSILILENIYLYDINKTKKNKNLYFYI